jgi:hypothetical protein
MTRYRRFAAIALAGAALVLAAAPASACRDNFNNYWLPHIPTDLRPGEVVLEVRRDGSEQAKHAPFTVDPMSGFEMFRLKVLRVVAGSFEGDEVLIVPARCDIWHAHGDIGLVGGYLSPAESHGNDAPTLVARDNRWSARVAEADAQRERARGGDFLETYRLYQASPDPAERKQIYLEIAPRLRAAAHAGNVVALDILERLEELCCGIRRRPTAGPSP